MDLLEYQGKQLQPAEGRQELPGGQAPQLLHLLAPLR
jgi:hypothetical protein